MENESTPNPNTELKVSGTVFTHADIVRVVDDFYTRIQHDEILSVPFSSVADWPEHIHRLTHFWWTRFGGKGYLFNEYNPVVKHFFAGFNRDLLARWLRIFHETLETQLTPDQARLWKIFSSQMGEGLANANDHYRKRVGAN